MVKSIKGHRRFYNLLEGTNDIHLGLADKLLIKKLVFEQTPYLGFRGQLAKEILLYFGYSSKKLVETYEEYKKLTKDFSDYMLRRL